MNIQGSDENRSPANFPRACEGMLKTTTETGDIGMFSIKPSRVPQSIGTPRKRGTSFNRENGHQKPRQNFQPYGVPVVDDRKRLPSYARDAASEVISMYENASQKSASRVFDEPDYRSYSMTQTSYSSYTLSNHRSYNSLRSQAEANPQVQRPRSPFAYPARLKRPGFRPSSPALADGGIVDYSRRAEIERLPPGHGHGTSSPSSLYAQRRRPHQSLRPDANRSTPSLLSQSSPPRRSSSPLVSRSNGISSHDWARKPGPASVNTSPARSTYSLASTVNLYSSAQPPSTTTTPGKVPPPSPLYYDYTEDFDVEVYNEPATIDPPPPFRIDKTIPEDRPMSSERPPSKEYDANKYYSAYQVLSSESTIPSHFDEQNAASHNYSKKAKESLTVQSTPVKTEIPPQAEQGSISQDRKSVRLSGLGYGAQLLRSHVDEAFGNFSSSALKFPEPKKPETSANPEIQDTLVLSENLERDVEMPSARSSYSVITSIPHFPSPPNAQDTSQSQHITDTALDMTSDTPVLEAGGSREPEYLGQPILPSLSRQHAGITVSHSDAETQDGKGFSEFNTGKIIVDAAGNSNISEAENRVDRQQMPQETSLELKYARRTPVTSPTIPEGIKLRKMDLEKGHAPPMSLCNRRRAADGQSVPQIQPLKRSQYYGGRRLDFSAMSDQGATSVPNFSHRNPKRDMPRSESPMLAPKPISPARQLKLKNSVPQLMKALPPLPPETSSRPGSPTAQLGAEEVELPCRFSPLEHDVSNSPNQAKPPVPAKVQSPNPSLATLEDKKELSKILDIGTSTTAEEGVSPPGSSGSSLRPLRMKLKVKSTSSQRPTSPPDSRPWNMAENYPWSAQSSIVRLPLAVPDSQTSAPKLPKFKLKVTRASNSTQGTVRIYRNPGESKPLMHLRNPKDFFTPSTGIDNIFRQVSRHLHSRKASIASSHTSQNDATLPSSSTSNPTSIIKPLTVASNIPQLPLVTTSPLITSEARSVFSDDSSNVQANHSLRLRGRLSNLRARIAAPYAMRAGTQSHDDITWRDRHGVEVSVPAATRSSPDLNGNRKSTETARPIRRWVERARRHKLKAKFHVQSWLKEAKSAVNRARSRSTTGNGGDLGAIRN